MTSFVPLDRERHKGLRLRPVESYAFARGETIMPVVASELPAAMLSLPLGFLDQGGVLLPVAVMGVEPERNLYVGPDGRWLAKYIPALLRAYPFRLLPLNDGRLVLCFDESSDLISRDSSGEILFEQDGTLAQVTSSMLGFLQIVENSRRATGHAVEALQRYNLLVPWNIKIKGIDREYQVSGVYCIDEMALNEVPPDALVDLQRKGALLLAYCQLISAQHLEELAQLNLVHAEVDRRNISLRYQRSAGDLQEIEIDWEKFNV